jgi:hypothetical protein
MKVYSPRKTRDGITVVDITKNWQHIPTPGFTREIINKHFTNNHKNSYLSGEWFGDTTHC